MTAIYNGLVQLDQNAQDTEDDAGNGGKTLWSTEGHCEKMDAVAPPSTAQKKGCLSGRLSSLVFADYRELRPVSFPNDLGGFVDGDPTLAGVVGRFRYKFGFYRLFNGMLGLKFCLLAHDANHSTLWALDERPLRRVVELRYTGHAETSSIMIGSDGVTTTTTSDYDAGGALTYRASASVSADARSKTTSIDWDGNGTQIPS